MLERVERGVATYAPELDARLRALEEDMALIRRDEMRRRTARKELWSTLRMIGAAVMAAAASHYWPPPTAQ